MRERSSLMLLLLLLLLWHSNLHAGWTDSQSLPACGSLKGGKSYIYRLGGGGRNIKKNRQRKERNSFVKDTVIDSST